MPPKLKGAARSTEYSHIAQERLAPRRRAAAREAPSTLVAMRATPSSVPAPPEPTKPAFADRYELEDRIGKGGMSEVWSALDRHRGARVAVKIMTLDCADPTRARARFEREAMLCRELRGRSFVEVFDHGVVGAAAFIAMSLLEGETLHERLRRRGRLRPIECRTMLDGIAEGLRLAHTLQIVHRDLKPGNIFFERRPPKASGTRSLRELDEMVKLLDFGIAKDGWDRSNITRPGMVLGSTSYMSPEHIECGPDIDARADLWSLAVVLYRALTGELPFEGRLAAALVAIRDSEARPPTSVNPSLPASADAFFARALEKDRAARFQTIDELVRGFHAAFPLPEDTTAEPTRQPSGHGRSWEYESIDIGSFEGSEAPTLDVQTAQSRATDRPKPRWRASVPSAESITTEGRTERKATPPSPPESEREQPLSIREAATMAPPKRTTTETVPAPRPRPPSVPAFRHSGAKVVLSKESPNEAAPRTRWRSRVIALAIASLVVCAALIVFRAGAVELVSTLLRAAGLD